MQGRIMGSALPLIAIYLYTKFYLNANSRFKGICHTRYRTDGRTDRTKQPLYFSPFGEHKKQNYVKPMGTITEITSKMYALNFCHHSQNSKLVDSKMQLSEHESKHDYPLTFKYLVKLTKINTTQIFMILQHISQRLYMQF